MCGLVVAISTTAGILTDPQRYSWEDGWKTIVGAIATSLISWRLGITNRRRADWFEGTPEWWLHLDKAPEALPLPAGAYAFIQRIEQYRISPATRNVLCGAAGMILVLGLLLLATSFKLIFLAILMVFVAADVTLIAYAMSRTSPQEDPQEDP